MKKEEAIAILDLSKLTAVSGRKYEEAVDMAIEALSAEDEQGGTWRDGFGFAHCSICGKGVPRAIGEQTPFNFCPYCGARMRNEK